MATQALSALPAAAVEYEFDVFLNYHRTDIESVRRIAERLRSRNVKVWWDKWSITAGEMFQTAMEKGIRNSRTTAAILGPGAVGYWQEEEYQLALSIQRGRNNRVIPVVLPGLSLEEIPGFLALRDAVDLRANLEDEGEFARLLRAITGVEPAPPPPAPPGPAAARVEPAAVPEDIALVLDDLVASLASNSITFFVGSEASAAQGRTPSRDCDIAYSLLSDLKLVPAQRPDLLLPADTAAAYYAMPKRDTGLEMAVVKLVQARTATAIHDRLARLLPKLMSFSRMRGRKADRQLIVSTSLDALMERALLQNRMRFARIVVRRKQGEFAVNDYRDIEFQRDNRVLAGGRSYDLANTDEVDEFIQSHGSRDVAPENLLEYFSAQDALVPVLFKLRGSQDVRDSCAISSTHFFDVTRALALEGKFLDPIIQILKHTAIVFLGTGFLTPEFRLSENTLLRDALGSERSEHARYLCQPRPEEQTDDCFRRLERGMWEAIKARAQDRGVTIVELEGGDLLKSLDERV